MPLREEKWPEILRVTTTKMGTASLLTGCTLHCNDPSSEESFKKKRKEEKEEIFFKTFLWHFSKPDSCPEYNEIAIKLYFASNRQFLCLKQFPQCDAKCKPEYHF